MSLCHLWTTFGLRNSVVGGARFWHSSTKPCFAKERILEWRLKKGLPRNPNAYGPLTDLPDYTFLDGRRTPPTTGQLKRATKQRDLTEKIIQLTGEIDFAVDREARLRREDEEAKQMLLGQKLKPKDRPLIEEQSQRRNDIRRPKDS